MDNAGLNNGLLYLSLRPNSELGLKPGFSRSDYTLVLSLAHTRLTPQRTNRTCRLPAAMREAQTCRYLVYSEANFEVFRPAGATRCTDGGEIWHGGGDRRSPPPCQI